MYSDKDIQFNDEDVWFNQVDSILNSMGIQVDMNNDGWWFMFENGWSPEQAVQEMLNGD